MYTFDINVVSASLHALGESRRIAFGAFLLERALPAFFQFQIDTGSAGGGQLRAALAQIWWAIETGASQSPKFITASECELVLPDSESSKSPYTSAAIDAVSISCNLLSYLELGDLKFLLEATESRRDTIDLFIQNNTGLNPMESQFEKRIIDHPLMQEELQYISDDLAFLAHIPEHSRPVLVASLQRVARLNYGTLKLKL